MTTTEPDLISPDELAARCQVHPETVTRMLRQGTIKGVRVGHLWRIPLSEVNRVLTDGTSKKYLKN